VQHSQAQLESEALLAFRPVPDYTTDVCEQLAQSHYLMVEWLGIEPVSFQSLVQRRNHYTSKPHTKSRPLKSKLNHTFNNITKIC